MGEQLFQSEFDVRTDKLTGFVASREDEDIKLLVQ
jgi:hypothetical protein